MSWTPHEYKLILKGAQLAIVDEYDNMARMAVFNRVAQNKERLNIKKDLFDVESARKRILHGDSNWKESKKINTNRYKKAQEAMKKWAEKQQKKG